MIRCKGTLRTSHCLKTTPAQQEAQRCYDSGTWSMSRTCSQRTGEFAYLGGKFRTIVVARSRKCQSLTCSGCASLNIIEVLIPETNKDLRNQSTSSMSFMFGLGAFFMSCFVGTDKCSVWWSTKPFNMTKVPHFV